MTKKQLILVVDDEPQVGMFFKRLLGRKNIQVVMATSGDQARQVLLEQAFQVVLLDLKLPDADGLQLLQEIKNYQPQCEVIIMTGYSNIRATVKAIQLGAYDFLEKPFEDIGELEKLIDDALLVSLGQGVQSDVWPEWEVTALQVGFVVGISQQMHRLLTVAHRIAAKNINVLVQGETGTGKEVLARFIHEASNRSGNKFIAVNCGALPENLLESELFGHEKGAFTGAAGQRRGIFELADRGTLFLDEVGEASLSIQVKLLRVLETGEFLRVGGENPVRTDVRIIAATNVDLEQAVKEKTFREDLFYRLDVVRLALPPLRERCEDIPILISYFIRKFAAASGYSDLQATPDFLRLLQSYHWPGNIRELSNTIEQAVAICGGHPLTPQHLTNKVRYGKVDNLRLRKGAGRRFEVTQGEESGPVGQLQSYLGEDFIWEQLPAEKLLISYRLARALVQRLGTALDRRNLPGEQPASLEEKESQSIAEALSYYDNNISLAARALGISRGKLYRRIKKYGLM